MNYAVSINDVKAILCCLSLIALKFVIRFVSFVDVAIVDVFLNSTVSYRIIIILCTEFYELYSYFTYLLKAWFKAYQTEKCENKS